MLPYGYKRLIIYIVCISLIMLFMVCFFVGIIISHLRITPEATINECFTQQVNMPCYVEVYTLGTLTEERTEKMDRIMDAESNDNSIAKNPTSSAYGKCQFLKSTRDYVEKKWGIKINWNDPEQQGYACERLLREEGDSHWLESKEVWDK